MNLSKKSKLILLVIVLGLGVGFFGFQYVMKPPTSIEEKSVDFEGSASELILKASQSPEEWNDKVVVLEGTLTAKDAKGITLNNQIYCQFKNPVKIALNNQKLKIKGRVIGYDDLLEELKLDQCILQK